MHWLYYITLHILYNINSPHCLYSLLLCLCVSNLPHFSLWAVSVSLSTCLSVSLSLRCYILETMSARRRASTKRKPKRRKWADSDASDTAKRTPVKRRRKARRKSVSKTPTRRSSRRVKKRKAAEAATAAEAAAIRESILLAERDEERRRSAKRQKTTGSGTVNVVRQAMDVDAQAQAQAQPYSTTWNTQRDARASLFPASDQGALSTESESQSQSQSESDQPPLPFAATDDNIADTKHSAVAVDENTLLSQTETTITSTPAVVSELFRSLLCYELILNTRVLYVL